MYHSILAYPTIRCQAEIARESKRGQKNRFIGAFGSYRGSRSAHHVRKSEFSEELDNLLHVGTQDALRKLVQQRKLTRQKLAGQFLYCAADRTRKAQQLSARRALLAAPGLVGPVPDADLMPDQLRAAIVLFASLLDERQRRLYAGLESLKCGWGGDARIAGLLGIDPGTVARGRKQLLAQDIERERVRRPGGGRPPLEKKLPR